MAETKQSSMPENLASTLAPSEFLDVVEYLDYAQVTSSINFTTEYTEVTKNRSMSDEESRDKGWRFA